MIPKTGQHWLRADGDNNGATVVAVTPDEVCFGGHDVEILYDDSANNTVTYHKDLSTFLSRFYYQQETKRI